MDNGREPLSPVDYLVFVSMLLVSALIGVYYAYKDRKGKSGTEGYLMANRSMGVIPVAFSLAVSFKSSITALGIPADVYFYGAVYVWVVFGTMLSCVVASVVFLPVLYNLGISSAYEYLERRFSKVLRLVASGFFMLKTLAYSAINIYGPALALSGVIGFGLTPAMLSTALVCIFYTTLGGLKGVIWADVFQGIIMVVGLLSVAIQGTIKAGGFQEVWRIASERGRINFGQFETDPRIRYTAWTGIIGGFIHWLGVFGTNQAQVQRLLSVKTRRKSMIAMILGTAGLTSYTAMASVCGIVIFAYYSDCDPLKNNCINKRDELMPYAVVEFFRGHNGMPGVFLACVFSASLSSVSSAINAIVTLAVEDFVKPYTKWTDRQYTTVSKGLALLFGATALGVGFLASVVESIIAFGIACNSAFLGPTLGVFLLGIWFPFANTAGAICGYVSGITIGVVMFIGYSFTTVPTNIDGKLDVSTKYCPVNCSYIDDFTLYRDQEVFSNVTEAHAEEHTELKGIQNLFAISFMYAASIAFAGTLLVGIVASLLTGGWKQRKNVDKRLIRPPFEAKIFRWIPEKVRYALRCGVSWKLKEDSAFDESEIKELAATD